MDAIYQVLNEVFASIHNENIRLVGLCNASQFPWFIWFRNPRSVHRGELKGRIQDSTY